MKRLVKPNLVEVEEEEYKGKEDITGYCDVACEPIVTSCTPHVGDDESGDILF